MNCSACGREIAEGSAFCPHCGTPVAGAEHGAQGPPAAARLRPSGGQNSGDHSAEEELWTGSYSPKAMVGPAIGLVILTLVGLMIPLVFDGPGFFIWLIAVVVLWGILAAVVLYRRATARYRLTTFRLFHEHGLLSRTRNRVEVIDINDVTLQQGLIERLFNVGTIHVQSSDVTHPDLYLLGIEDVRNVTDLIDNTRRAERQRRGVFMENIGASSSPIR